MYPPNEWLSFFVTLCACALALVQCASISCQVPSNLNLHNRFKGVNTDEHTILLLTPPSTMEMSAGFMVHENLYTSQSCPLSLPSTGSLDDRSTCPFSNVIDHDPNRYPMTLTKAVCRCKGCFGQDDNHHCEHLVYNIQVLRRTDHCEAGFYLYEEEWYDVAVGCVCALRPVTESVSVSPVDNDKKEFEKP